MLKLLRMKSIWKLLWSMQRKWHKMRRSSCVVRARINDRCCQWSFVWIMNFTTIRLKKTAWKLEKTASSSVQDSEKTERADFMANLSLKFLDIALKVMENISRACGYKISGLRQFHTPERYRWEHCGDFITHCRVYILTTQILLCDDIVAESIYNTPSFDDDKTFWFFF